MQLSDSLIDFTATCYRRCRGYRYYRFRVCHAVKAMMIAAITLMFVFILIFSGSSVHAVVNRM